MNRHSKNEDLKNGQARWPFARHTIAAQEWQAVSPDRERILRKRKRRIMMRRTPFIVEEKQLLIVVYSVCLKIFCSPRCGHVEP